MKTLTATYVWSVTVTTEVPDDASNEQQREALDKVAAGATIDLKHPVLHACDDNPDLID